MSTTLASALKLTFKDPAPVRRPKKCHLYHVWSLKRGKQITLYGQLALHYWVLLEADPNVHYTCERPYEITRKGRNIISDFWIEAEQNRFTFLTSEKSKGKQRDAIFNCKSFIDFCKSQNISVDVVSDLDMKPKTCYFSNWQSIIQQCVANKEEISEDLLGDLAQYFEKYRACTLGQLYVLFNVDPVILRATAFELLRRHVLSFRNPETEFISQNTTLEWGRS